MLVSHRLSFTSPSCLSSHPLPLSRTTSTGTRYRAKGLISAPHVGHLHSLLLTDTLARFSRLRNPNRPVVFSTGTDEHGLKVQQAAKAKGMGEQEFCDGVSERFRVSFLPFAADSLSQALRI